MARLPTRRELADKIDKLERDLAIAAAGAGVGAGLARSPALRGAAISGLARVSPYALAIDALAREEESLLGRGVIGLGEQATRLATGVEARARAEGLPIAGRPAVSRRKPKQTKFNKMVSAGMKKVKASTSYGKKGTVSNAKKAFSVVTKAASAVTKGHKLPKSGIKRRIMSVMRKIR
jgi:hypothetical protein